MGPTGIRRLVADGETDGHADRFWALALAVAAAQAAPVEYDYRGVTPPRQDGGFRDEPDEDDGINRNWWRAPLGSGMRGGL